MLYLTGILSRVWGYVAVVAAAFALYVGVKREGKKEAQAEQIKIDLDEVKKANEIERDVRGTSNADVAERLRKWTRD